MRNILVSAYACEPLKGSEPAVGWQWVLALARRNRVYVITRSNNQQVIEDNMPIKVAENIFFYYYDTPAFLKKLKKKDKGLYFYNFCWQWGILKVAKRIIKSVYIDYAIHLTFGSMWMPTFLPLLNIPLIWGPIGGGECVPKSFVNVLPIKQRIVQIFRYVLNATTILNPFIVLPCWKAKVILVRTRNTFDVIPEPFKCKARVLLETAMDDSVFEWKKEDTDADIVQLIISARLISIKNIPTAIRSLRYVKTNKKWKLTILGSGPDFNLIKNEIEKQRLTNVEIIPFMSRLDALKRIAQSDIFIFPSLKEGGTWALMEAMAIGLPVVCVNWAGMAVETDCETAIQLDVTNPKQMEKDMGMAITQLIDSPDLRKQIGQKARRRIKEVFSWDKKALFMESLFDELENKNV